MNAKSITQLRLVVQGIHHPTTTKVEDVVRKFGAVQAQDYYGALWGIGLRMKSATEKSVEKAIADKKIVRSWPMRGTLHFTTADDLRWMLTYLAPRIIKRAASVHRQVELDAKTFRKSSTIVERALEGGKQLTREELYAFLEKSKIKTDNSRGLHILGYLAHEKLICLTTRKGKQHRFALLDEWLPASDIPTLDEALAELARRYFTGHGPASINDFTWWTGLTLTEARRGLSIVESELQKIEVDGETFWMSKNVDEVKPFKSAYLLPAYDEYTVAYKDRSHLLDPAHATKARNGIFNPVIVVDGKIAGTWKRTLNRERVSIGKELFKKNIPSLAKAEKAYGKFLGLSVD
jgi:hypothetical protein